MAPSCQTCIHVATCTDKGRLCGLFAPAPMFKVIQPLDAPFGGVAAAMQQHGIKPGGLS